MRKPQWGALAALLGTAGLVLGLASTAQSQRPERETERQPERPRERSRQPERQTLKTRIVRATRLPEKNVDAFLAALGPAVRDHLRGGEQVELPGLGVFRVVQVPEHRDLVGGRPALIPASNYVEFLPSAGLAGAANAPGAVPARTIPPFEYNPLPTQTRSERAPYARQPNIRTP